MGAPTPKTVPSRPTSRPQPNDPGPHDGQPAAGEPARQDAESGVVCREVFEAPHEQGAKPKSLFFHFKAEQRGSWGCIENREVVAAPGYAGITRPFGYVHRHINRAPTFSLIILDDHSRFVVGHGTDDAERADLVIGTFEKAVARHGKPEMMLHDKGSAFWSWRGISRFTTLLTELDIDQIAAEHKEWNGKLEVFNANLAKELFDVHRFYDTAEMRRRLATHLHGYNHARTNHALGGRLVPADRFYGRVEEVLARIEAGVGRELGDGLELRDRRLELFKVSSRDGVTEVWLMGQRLLELRG